MKTKVIGFFTAWGNQQWAVPALHNHLKICDEIFVSVEPHHPGMKCFEDDTYKLLREEFKDDKRVRFFPYVGVADDYIRHSSDSNPNVGKCLLLNKFLKYAAKDDILMICDSDEFYGEEAVKELKYWTVKGGWDSLSVHNNFFCINTDWYMEAMHRRMFRNKDNSRFFPTQNFQPQPFRTVQALEKNPMCHASMLFPLSYKRKFWETEDRPMQVTWLNDIYEKWVPGEANTELIDKNYRLTGNKGFWFTEDNMGAPMSSPWLYKYEGEWPEEIEKSGIREIKDFRGGTT